MAQPTGRYDAAFFADISHGGRESAKRIAPILFDRCRPRSVVDVGCGEGYFLDAFAALGVGERLGVDGPFNDGVKVRAGGHEFRACDLQEEPLVLERRYDLAICLEVGEHLRPQHARSLVDGLVKAAPVIAFSAAVPGQGGEGHVNERPQSAWAEDFAAHGFHPVDAVRPLVWDDESVSWWYAQNLLVYSEEPAGTPFILDVIHPRRPPATVTSGRAAVGVTLTAARDRLRALRGRRSRGEP